VQKKKKSTIKLHINFYLVDKSIFDIAQNLMHANDMPARKTGIFLESALNCDAENLGMNKQLRVVSQPNCVLTLHLLVIPFF